MRKIVSLLRQAWPGSWFVWDITILNVSSMIDNKSNEQSVKLSKILRRLLRKSENLSPLGEEISFIDDYLGIEMVRFGDKLRFCKEIDENTLDRLVPSMILQPIIENSIRHGLANKVDGGMVRLRTWLEGTRLHISIEDDGVGFAQKGISKVRSFGLAGMRERIVALGGCVKVRSSKGRGTRIEVTVPDATSPAPLPAMAADQSMGPVGR